MTITSEFAELKEPSSGADAFHSTRDSETSRRPPQSTLPPRFAKQQQGHDDGRRRPASNDSYERHRRPPPKSDDHQMAYNAETRGPKSDRSLWRPSENEHWNNQRNQFDHQGARDANARAPGDATQGPVRHSPMENSRPNHQAQQRSCIGGDINVNAKSYNRTHGPGGVPNDRGHLQQQAALQSMFAAQGETGHRSDTKSLPRRRDNIDQKMANLQLSTSEQGFEADIQLQNVMAPQSYSVPPVVTNVNYSSAGGPQDVYKQVC